jgi:hypothetical protein
MLRTATASPAELPRNTCRTALVTLIRDVRRRRDGDHREKRSGAEYSLIMDNAQMNRRPTTP